VAADVNNTQQADAIAAGDDRVSEWGGYAESGQRDILAALGEQTRVGVALAMRIQAYFRLGFTPVMIAAMCRQSANEPQSSSRP